MADYYQPDDEWWRPAPDFEPARDGKPPRITIRANSGQPDGVAGLINAAPAAVAAEAPANPLHSLVQGQQEAPQNALEQRGVVDQLLGLTGPRFQMWPERMIRSAVTAPYEVMTTGMLTTRDPYGRITSQQPVMDPETGHPSSAVIERAMDIGGAAIGGGMPMAVKGALGSAGGRLIQTAKEAPAFYSGVERALEGVNQKAATGEQWLNTLRNRPGVKPEELEWTGIDDFLLSKAGEKVSKDDVAKYMAEHRTEIKEIEKLNDPDNFPQAIDDLAHEMRNEWIREEGHHNAPDIEHFRDMARDRVGDDPDFLPAETMTRYHQYQLPGGENYRELLLTLPEKPATGYRIRAASDQGGGYEVINSVGDRVHMSPRQSDAMDWIKTGGGESYRSSHWDEPNIVAHVRMNDRQIPGVGKSLHLEEVQSDWHQQGKKQGYLKEQPQFWVRNTRSGNNSPFFDTMAEADAYRNALPESVRTSTVISQRPNKTGTVPDAPFKSTWADLALKRAISKAAREGYDSISWTPGEQQAARYDLSKQIDSLKTYKNENGNYEIHGKKLGNKDFEPLAKDVSPQKLEETVGKEMAQKILDREKNIKPYEPITKLPEGYALIRDRNGNSKSYPWGEWGITTTGAKSAQSFTGRYHATEEEAIKAALEKINGEARHKYDSQNNTFDNADLKVGGEGMKAFYDKMLVDKANKLAKSMGGKVEWQKISNPDEYFAIAPTSKVTMGEAQGPMAAGHPDIVAGRDSLVGVYTNGHWFKNEPKAIAQKTISDYSKHSVLTKDGKYHYFDDAKAAQDFIDSHTMSVPVLKLTDKMKEAAGTGFPLYMQGLPFSFTPVDYDPFKRDGFDDKLRKGNAL